MSSTPELESAIPEHLRIPGHQGKHAPGTYTPVAPAFSARFRPDLQAVVMAYLGVQSRAADDESARALLDDLRQRLGSANGPDEVDRARYVDVAGYTTVISIAYWTDSDAFDEWFESEGAAWLSPQNTDEGTGVFLELITPSMDRVETIFSGPQAIGVGLVADGLSAPIAEHQYWGSMRDRLPLAQTDALDPSGELELRVSGAVREVVPHHNSCLIRSGQSLHHADEEERAVYLSDVEPSLQEGMDYLQDHGAAIGCYENRYMTVIDEHGAPTPHTFGMSWWRDMSSLEAWSRADATHLKIFGAAVKHFTTPGVQRRLHLYHEVTVPSAGQQRFVYVGCHDRTGLLRAVIPEAAST